MIVWPVLLLAVAILWFTGSLVVGCFRPWRHFNGPDWWIGWLLIFLWWAVLAGMAFELWLESRDPACDMDDDDGR